MYRFAAPLHRHLYLKQILAGGRALSHHPPRARWPEWPHSVAVVVVVVASWFLQQNRAGLCHKDVCFPLLRIRECDFGGLGLGVGESGGIDLGLETLDSEV